MKNNIDSLGILYREKQSDEVLTSIFLVAVDEARKIVNCSKNLSSLRLPEGFYAESALELVSKLKAGKIDKNISTLLNNICVTNANKYDSMKIIKYLNEKCYNTKIDSKLYLEDILREIEKYSPKIKIVILYVLSYGDIKILPKLRKFFSPIKFSILVGAVIDIKNKIDNTSYNFDKYIPVTPLGRTILVLKLMEKHPELSTFLILLKDFKKFLQFIIVNQGRTFKVPAVSNITSDIISISKTINNVEQNDIDDKDMISLNSITFSNMDLVSSLKKFIDEAINDTSELYKKLSDKIWGNKDKYTKEELRTIYEYITARSKSEINLQKSINGISEKFIREKLEEIQKIEQGE